MTYNKYWNNAVQEIFDEHTRQISQIMRLNMETDAKEAAFSKMKEDIMPYKVQDHVVTNLMQAYLSVTNSTYAQALKNTLINY